MSKTRYREASEMALSVTQFLLKQVRVRRDEAAEHPAMTKTAKKQRLLIIEARTKEL